MPTNSSGPFPPSFSRVAYNVFGIYLLFLLLAVAFSRLFPALGMEVVVVFSGNTILLLATLLALFFFTKSIAQEKPFALVKYVYLAMFAKLGVCLLPAVVYILYAGKNINKPGLLFCAFMYLVYSYAEVSLLLKQNKLRSNAKAGSSA